MLAKNIKIGDILTSKSESSRFRTKGKQYEVQSVYGRINGDYFTILDDDGKRHRFDFINAHNYWEEIEDPNQGVTLNQAIVNLEKADRLKPETGNISARMVIWDCRKDESLKFILSLIKA